jgi:predicted nucleic acid-binding protein
MKPNNPLLTLDSNVVIAAFRTVEPVSEKCAEILTKAAEQFVLAEPSIFYQEVCGTLARRASLEIADRARKQLDLILEPNLLANCDRSMCLSAFALCGEYRIYSIDALYLQVALTNRAILVSLDKEDFINKVKVKKTPIEAYSVDDFPY